MRDHPRVCGEHAIYILRNSGFRIRTRPENAPENYSNIDLLLGNEVWEIKVPKYVENSQSTRFIETNLRKAKGQFGKYYQVEGEDATKTRVVFSNRYRKANDHDVEKRLSFELGRHGIDEAILVKSDGTIKYFRA